ncbi:MAG: hypothetical protein LQ345_004293 [Seirophora villosa]|nr:MAG: hypothetical protein LQ345_004293 [Seirophora villosa]
MSSSTHPVSEPLPATEETKPESNLDRTTAGQDADVAQKQAVDTPPNGGYGWICVLCCFWINAHTWGINSSYGIFLQYYLDNDQYPGASALQFAFVGGLSISTSLLVSPAATATTRIYGTRVTLLIGVFFETLALIGASFAHETWQLFLSQGVCFGWGMGYLFVGSVGVVPQWFTTKRSFANGIATAGSGIGGLMYNLATNAMIQSLGIAWAFRILGILAFTVNVICALLIKDRNKAIGSSQLAFDYTLFARPEYLLLLGWGFFSMLGYIVLLFSLPSYATSIGLSPRQGSIVGALLNLGQGIGRPCVGIFSDSAGRINIAGFLTVIAGLFCLVIWIFAKNFGVLVFFALIVGSVSGTFWTTIAPVGAEVVGLKELPSALSILWLVLVLPATFAEAIALQLRQKTGNIYLHAQIFTGLMYIVAGGVCMWLLRAWKIGQMESVAAEEEKFPAQIGAVVADGHHPTRSKGSKSNVIKRLCAWKRV